MCPVLVKSKMKLVARADSPPLPVSFTERTIDPDLIARLLLTQFSGEEVSSMPSPFSHIPGAQDAAALSPYGAS